MNILKEKNISGIIVFAISDLDYSFLEEIDIPIVMIAKEVEKFTSIAYDDYHAIATIMNHLQTMKKKKIAYIGVDQRDVTTGFIRYSAYRGWCEKNNKIDISKFGDFSYESGYKLAKEIFQAESNIDAVVCATDNIALGVRKFLSEKNISGITVTGVGNDKLLRFLYPDHISINFKYEDAGRKAAKSILKNIAGKESSNTKIKGQLVEE